MTAVSLYGLVEMERSLFDEKRQWSRSETYQTQ